MYYIFNHFFFIIHRCKWLLLMYRFNVYILRNIPNDKDIDSFRTWLFLYDLHILCYCKYVSKFIHWHSERIQHSVPNYTRHTMYNLFRTVHQAVWDVAQLYMTALQKHYEKKPPKNESLHCSVSNLKMRFCFGSVHLLIDANETNN